jgi:hypothetical protein
MSKLNSILFGYQNTENLHSFMAMFKNYGVAFFIILVLIVLLFMVVLTNIPENLIGTSQSS